jgi:hypothetical protein
MCPVRVLISSLSLVLLPRVTSAVGLGIVGVDLRVVGVDGEKPNPFDVDVGEKIEFSFVVVAVVVVSVEVVSGVNDPGSGVDVESLFRMYWTVTRLLGSLSVEIRLVFFHTLSADGSEDTWVRV